MLEKIVRNVEELNATAVHLRQNGNMDELRMLAKKWAVPYQQTEDFILGKRYRLSEIPVTDREFRTAFEKLREEMLALNDKSFADVIGWYIIRKCREEETLSVQVLMKHKSLQRCLDFITGKAFDVATERAKKKGMNRIPENTGLALSENEVFPWAEEYYRIEDKAEAEKKEAEEKEKILTEWKKAEEKGNRGKTKTAKNAAKKTGTGKKKMTPEKKGEEAIPAEKNISASEEKKEAFGQMSLFDLA